MIRINRIYIANIILAFLISIAYISLLSRSLAQTYFSFSLAIVIIFTFIGLLIIKRIKRVDTVIIMLTIIYMIISVLINSGGVGSVVTFVTAMLVFEVTTNCSLNKRISVYLKLVSELAIIYLFVYSFRFIPNWYYTQMVDINPNTLSLFMIFAIYIFDNVKFVNSHNKYLTEFEYMVLLGLAFTGLVFLKARGAMASLISYILLNLIPDRFQNRKVLFSICIVLTIVSTLFPFVYMGLYSRRMQLLILGKSLYTGREYIWLRMFQELRKSGWNWLFGMGSKIQLWEGHSLNVHNDSFATIVNFGLIGFLLNEVFILYNTYIACRNIKKEPALKKWLYMFISTVFVLGMTETVTHWAPIFIFSYMGLGLSVGNNSEQFAVN